MSAATLESRLDELGVHRTSPGHGPPTATPTRNAFSGRFSISLITRASRTRASTRLASGWPLFWSASTSNTATAVSKSRRPTNITADKLWGFASTALLSTIRLASAIQEGVHDRFAFAISLRWSGSISYVMISISHRICRLRRPSEWQPRSDIFPGSQR